MLTVVNAADLDREGGLLSPDGGVTLYAYTGVTDGASDTDPDTVTMADSVPAEWPTDTTDPETGDVIPAEVRLDVWPERLDVTAMVDLGDGETIPAVVPHALRPLLVDGDRETGAGETVQLARVAGVWTVSDVIGRRAQIGMNGLGPDVVDAIESAAGGVEMIHADHAPDRDGSTAGDTWFQHGDAGVVGQWHWDGAQWVSDTLTGAVLSNIDAGSITSGDIQGLDMYSPSKTAQPRIHIGGSQLEIIRPTTDATGAVIGEQTTTVLGGESADQLQFYGADGQVRGGFDPDGVMTSKSVQTGAVSISGTDVVDIAQRGALGIIAGHNFTAPIGNIGQSELAIVDLQFTATPGRTYQFQVNNPFFIPTKGRLILYFRPLLGADGSDTVYPPSTSTPSIGYGIFSPAAYYEPSNVAQQVAFSYLWRPTGITQPTACRVLLSALFQGSGSATLVGSTGGFFVQDVGSTYTGILADGNIPGSSTAVGTQTNEYNPDQIAFWQPDLFATTYGGVAQGYSASLKRQDYSMFWFPPGLVSDISGAQTVASIQVYVGCWNSALPTGFIPRISYSIASYYPSSPSGSGTFDAHVVPLGGGLWITLPTSWYPNIANGSYKAIAFGIGAGTDQKYKGTSLMTPSFRATFTK